MPQIFFSLQYLLCSSHLAFAQAVFQPLSTSAITNLWCFQTNKLIAKVFLLQVLLFPADNFVPLILEGLREEGEDHGGWEGSLTEEAAQLLKLWLSLSGETEDASTMAAERYKTKALPLKHRPWGRQGSGVFRACGKVWAPPNLRIDQNCTLGVVRNPSGHLGGGHGTRSVRRQLISVWGGEGFTPAQTPQTQTPLLSHQVT